MSALNELDVSELAPVTEPNIIKEVISRLFWTWYSANQDHKLVRISLLHGLIKKQVYVRDLKDVFTLLFGSENGLGTQGITL